MSWVTSSAMLRPSTWVWGLTETALQTTGEGQETLVLGGRSDEVAAAAVVKWRRVGEREEHVKELIREAEAIGCVEGGIMAPRLWIEK